jgi:hypothetical protein
VRAFVVIQGELVMDVYGRDRFVNPLPLPFNMFVREIFTLVLTTVPLGLIVIGEN